VALSGGAMTVLSQRGGDHTLGLRTDGGAADANFANAAPANGITAFYAA